MRQYVFVVLVLAVASQGLWTTLGATTGNSQPTTNNGTSDMTKVNAFLEQYNTTGEAVYNSRENAAWNYESNLTEYNKQIMLEENLNKDKFRSERARDASLFNWKAFNGSVARQFKKISDIGTSALRNQTKLRRLGGVVADMQSIYSKARVCLSGRECLNLEPGLTQLMVTNRTYETLLEAWESWRDATGRHIRPLFLEYVTLSNEAIRDAGYNDTGEYWRSAYEDSSFQQQLEGLYRQLKPLYQNLHIYVRRKLKQKYGEENFPTSGHIPAHLLGNMWAQQWNNILDLLLPYPGQQSVDVTPNMVKQKYTPLKMFKTAESFFKSLGLLPMTPTFWNKSIIERPADGRDLTCHASAWDFFNINDFRIKMCTRVTMEDLITIHHEMGHIQYFMQYKDQPLVFRDGANPGFHEAVGDTLALSVGTPVHLHSIGLLSTVATDPQNRPEINYLMKLALEKIAFLPFGYLIDLYRWDVFSGKTPESEYNKHWWDLRCKYQGLSPPTWRSENDFDPGAKFHVAANVPYIRYFVSFVIQFQFHKALCAAAGHTGPTRTCDIYKSVKAGDQLSKMLKMGSSCPWPDAMEAITGQRKMDASALMEYFEPLTQWLQQENAQVNDTTGWTDGCPTLSQEEKGQEWLENTYEPLVQEVAYRAREAEWNYQTNLTERNQVMTVDATLALTKFSKDAAINASKFHWESFRRSATRRQFEQITDLGIDALNDTHKLKRIKELTSTMESVYSQGRVCLKKSSCMELDPGLSRLMASSRNYSELLSAWEGWRHDTGRKVKDEYAEFVTLSNQAVRKAGFNDTGDQWRSAYETETFQADIEQLLDQVLPLYQQLHAYVRGRLRRLYGDHWFPSSGHIPAHLLGNMWAGQWNNIYDVVQPYGNQPLIDVTSKLKAQNFTAEKMFRTAEEFYTSLGLLPMPASFWRDSMMTKPKDGRKVVCHPSAWGFFNRKDYRIKMCTDMTMENLITIHHEMGHIQYLLQYRDQPIAFRSGANPESQMNFLLKMALEKMAALPFAYLVDQWRWSVFGGQTTPDDYNSKWLGLRCKYQGLSSPVTRSESDFDPGAMYHVAANIPYIRYFVSVIIQFQFHKAMCDAAGHTGPLHNCDIYQSRAAGTRLGDMLKMGSSRPWPEAMFRMTGQRRMDAGPLIEYFQPLIDWLKIQNVDENIGWSERCPPPPPLRRPPTVVTCPTSSPPVGAATAIVPLNTILSLAILVFSHIICI